MKNSKALTLSELLSPAVINVNLKNNRYYGGIAWYLLTHKIEDKPREQVNIKIKLNEKQFTVA